MELDGQESSNIEDRRGDSGGGFGGGGFGGGGFGGMGGGFGGGGIPLGGGLFKGGFGLIAIVVISLILGVNPLTLLGGFVDSGGGGGGSYMAPQTQQRTASRPTTSDPEERFIARVLKSTEDVWGNQFQQMGRQYKQPRLVLFRGQTQTACGAGQAAMGPFYCPPDQRVYIDLSFFDELSQRFHSPGQFPQAYVVAHEVGHHVQNLLGIEAKVSQLRENMSKRDANAMSVRVELQADCLAGVWAYHASRDPDARLKLTDQDVEQAINAATSIGDDTLQKQAQGRIVPDSFTHGSSAQRVRWFKTGLDNGDIRRCDTFNAKQL